MAVLVQTWLALRSLLWTILLPGMVAGYVPWTVFGLALATLLATGQSWIAK